MAVAVVALLGQPGWAQEARPSVEQLRPIDRQHADFYQAIAAGPRGIEVSWSVSRPTVPLNEEFILTLTVRHAANPQELVKPDLRRFDRFTSQFQILDRSDPPAAPTASEVRFTYTLRPRRVGATEIPTLKYVYYRWGAPEGKEFPTTYARGVPLTVTPAVAKPATVPPVPLEAPEAFFTLAEERTVGTSGRFGWLGPVATVPAVVLLWVGVWRRLFPDAARLAKLRRNRATRVALDQLRAALTAADPAGAAAAAVRGYLVARFGIPTAAQTPAEVAAALRAGRSPESAEEVEEFLRACDAARFGPGTDNGASLVRKGELLLLNRTRTLILALGLLGWFALVAPAEELALSEVASPVAHFEQGLALRSDAAQARPAFARAAAGFDHDWHRGHRTPALALNRGRAHFLADHLPEAIRALHDGLALAPWEVELQQALAECRARVAYPTESRPEDRVRPDPTRDLRHRVSPWDLFAAATVCSLLVTVGLARRLTAGDRWAVPLALVGAAGWLLVGAGALMIEAETRADREHPVQVIAADTVLRTGNGESFPARLEAPLPRGAEVRELTRRGGWVQVELPGGAVGWVRERVVLARDEPAGEDSRSRGSQAEELPLPRLK